MTPDQFRNAILPILLLNCIDADEFYGARENNWALANHPDRLRLWDNFQKDPVKFYIHASAEHRSALWAIIEKRLTIGENND